MLNFDPHFNCGPPYPRDHDKWTNLNLLKNTNNISTIISHLPFNWDLVRSFNKYQSAKLFFHGFIVPSSVEIASMVLERMMKMWKIYNNDNGHILNWKAYLSHRLRWAKYIIFVPCTTTSHNSVKTSISWYSAGYDTPAIRSL